MTCRSGSGDADGIYPSCGFARAGTVDWRCLNHDAVKLLFDPMTAYRFIVTLNPGDAHLPPQQAARSNFARIGGFQEVKGLGADLEVTPYNEGGVND